MSKSYNQKFYKMSLCSLLPFILPYFDAKYFIRIMNEFSMLSRYYLFYRVNI